MISAYKSFNGVVGKECWNCWRKLPTSPAGLKRSITSRYDSYHMNQWEQNRKDQSLIFKLQINSLVHVKPDSLVTYYKSQWRLVPYLQNWHLFLPFCSKWYQANILWNLGCWEIYKATFFVLKNNFLFFLAVKKIFLSIFVVSNLIL